MISYFLSGLDNMKFNHEETKNTKKNQKIFVFFVSSWLVSGGAFKSGMSLLHRRPLP
jgi:hypothetical protein